MEKAIVPKYLQISEEIVSSIRQGKLMTGSKVLSENEIISRYHVSNTTARRALAEIERAGWVTRVKARGTFVRRQSIGRSVDRILGFTRNMVEAGRTPSTRLLSVYVLDGGWSLSAHGRQYQIPGQVCRVERLRLADGIPMMKEVRYVSLQLCPGIDKLDLESSLYRIYETSYGLELTEVCQNLRAVTLEDQEDLSLFALTGPLPAFLVEGVTFCGKEVILEMESSLYRGDVYSFSVTARR